MPRYHFNFRDGRNVVDDGDGADFETFELAYLEAFNAAREMWHDRLSTREDPQECSFEITDADGTVLTVVPFAEVLESCRKQPPAPVPFVEAGARIERARRLSGELAELLARTRETVIRSQALLRRAASS